MIKLTASSLPIVYECRWTLRDDADFPATRVASDRGAADAGTAGHASIDRAIQGSPPDSDEAHMALAWIRAQACSRAESEISYYWNRQARTSHRLGSGVNREYEARGVVFPRDVPGTVDAILHFGAVKPPLVVDWKLGYMGGQTAAKDHKQLRFLGFMVARNLGINTVRIAIAFKRGDSLEHTEHTLTPFDLDEIEQEIEALFANDKPQARAGEHCSYCPALGACPATRAALDALSIPDAFAWSTDIQGPEHAAWMASRLPGLKKAVEAVKEALEGYADSTGGIRSNGKVWRCAPYMKANFNTSKARELLGARASECESQVEVKPYKWVNG